MPDHDSSRDRDRDIDSFLAALEASVDLEESQRSREAARRQAGKEFDAFRGTVLEQARLRRSAAKSTKHPPVPQKRSRTRLKPDLTPNPVQTRKTRPGTGKQARKGK